MNKLKIFIAGMCVFFVGVCLIYLLFAFINWNLNVGEWGWISRLLSSLLVLFYTPISFAVGITFVDYEE